MGWNIELPDAEWFDLKSPRLGDLINEVVAQPNVALDTETTGLNVVKDIPLFWSLSWGQRRVCMPASTIHRFGDAFKQRDKNWIFANAKYDAHMMAQVGIKLEGNWIDTQVMHALIYEEQPHGLKSMAKQVLGWGWKDFFDTFHPLNVLAEEKEHQDVEDEDEQQMIRMLDVDPTKKKRAKKPATRKESIGEMLLRCEQENRSLLTEYASNDAYGTFQIYLELKKQLENEATWSLYPDVFANLWDVFYKTERPFTKVLWKCERNGLLIDTDYIKSIKGPVEDGMERIKKEIAGIMGRVVNLNADDQMRDYFFKEKGYDPVKLTKGGKSGIKKASVAKDVLKELAVFDPVAKKMVEFNELDKLYSTYIIGLSKHLSAFNRIHCRLNQDIARTGRLSSSNPNLQNIPKPESDKYKIRRAFIAREGYCLIVADYEQLEMRLLAAAAQEPDMINIFLTGKDIHMGNAALVFGPIYKERYGRELTYQDLVDAKKIDKDVKAGKRPQSDMTEWVEQCLFARNAIKAVGFGLNYGMKSKKLAANIGVSVQEAEDIIAAYMATYPTVSRFYEDSILDCRQTLKSFTLLGRRRFLPEINGYNKYERFKAERQAGNTIIQGTAADAARMAMIQCDEAQLDYHYGAEMLMQIHDELMFECPIETSEQCEKDVREWMEHPFPTELDVPLSASSGRGSNWMDAK